MSLKESGLSNSEIDLKTLLNRAVDRTKAQGTSTFVMGLIDSEKPELNILNLGDSRLMVLRPNPKTLAFDLIFKNEA